MWSCCILGTCHRLNFCYLKANSNLQVDAFLSLHYSCGSRRHRKGAQLRAPVHYRLFGHLQVMLQSHDFLIQLPTSESRRTPPVEGQETGYAHITSSGFSWRSTQNKRQDGEEPLAAEGSSDARWTKKCRRAGKPQVAVLSSEKVRERVKGCIWNSKKPLQLPDVAPIQWATLPRAAETGKPQILFTTSYFTWRK